MAARISRGSRSASRPCGIWPSSCWAAATPWPTSAASAPPPAQPPNRRSRGRSARAWPSCSTAAAIPRPRTRSCWPRRTAGVRNAASPFEGIANNAILIAHGVTEVEQLPDEDLQIGVLLALLQDDAKNQSSYLTWQEGRPQQEVAATLRRDFLVSAERADKLSGAWRRNT